MSRMHRDIEPWQVWLARIAFADKPYVSKVRPVLILDSAGGEIAVLKVTSSRPQSMYAGMFIDDWVSLGLDHPSYLCCWPAYRLPENILVGDGPLGTLSVRLVDEIEEVLIKLGTYKK